MHAHLVLASLMLFAATGSPGHSPVDACIARFRKEPANYEHARCIYVAGRKEPQLAKRKIHALRKEFPKSLYLELSLAHFARSQSLGLAEKLYEKISDKFASVGDDDGECIALGNRLAILTRTGSAEEIRSVLDRIAAIEARTRDSLARIRATVVLAGTRNAHFWSVGEQYQRLRAISASTERTLPYSLRKILLLRRGHAAYQNGDLVQAQSDAGEMRAIGLENDDPVCVARGDRLIGRISLGRFTREPTPNHRAQAETHLRVSLKSARDAHQRGLEAVALFGLSAVMLGEQKREAEALELVEDCLLLTAERDPLLHANCVMVKSQLLSHQRPEQALELAEFGATVLGASSSGLDRVQSWRTYMQQAWSAGDLEFAQYVSSRALAEIERLRCDQEELNARREIFSVWADDYNWLAHQYLSSPLVPEHQRVVQAFALSERARARTLHEEARALHRAGNAGNSGTRSPCVEDLDALAAKEAEKLLSQTMQRLRSDEALMVFQVSHRLDSEGVDHGGVWVYVVTSKGIQTKRIPMDRMQVQSLVRLLRGARGTEDEGELLTAFRKRMWSPLSEILDPSLQSVVLIADGGLSLVPWSSIAPELAFSRAPSVRSWLRVTRNERREAARRGVALVDPINELKDELDLPQVQASPTTRSARDLVGVRLPHSQREAELIQKYLGPSVKIFRGPKATKQGLAESLSSEVRLLHISAHSIIDTRDFAGTAIALSSEDAKPEDWLRVSEIQDMKLDGALVVLGGCSTAFGKSVLGEGVLSLGRAFLRAGASAVVASLWPVEDAQSADFLGELYRELGQGERLDRAVSTVARRLNEAGTQGRSHSGFVVIGDGRYRFASRQSRSFLVWLSCLGALALAVAGALALLRRER